MNWILRKYRIWKIKRNTEKTMRQTAYVYHVIRIAFIGGTIGYINGAVHAFPDYTKRILIVAFLAAVSGFFVMETIKYLKAALRREE